MKGDAAMKQLTAFFFVLLCAGCFTWQTKYVDKTTGLPDVDGIPVAFDGFWIEEINYQPTFSTYNANVNVSYGYPCPFQAASCFISSLAKRQHTCASASLFAVRWRPRMLPTIIFDAARKAPTQVLAFVPSNIRSKPILVQNQVKRIRG